MINLVPRDPLERSLRGSARSSDRSFAKRCLQAEAAADLKVFLRRFSDLDQFKSLNAAIREISQGSSQEFTMQSYAGSLLLLLKQPERIVARVLRQLNAIPLNNSSSEFAIGSAKISVDLPGCKNEGDLYRAFPLAMRQALAQTAPFVADANRLFINLCNETGANFSGGGFRLNLDAARGHVTIVMKLVRTDFLRSRSCDLRELLAKTSKFYGFNLQDSLDPQRQATPGAGTVVISHAQEPALDHISVFTWAATDLPRLGDVLRAFNVAFNQVDI